jgi:CHAT domain-containing protein
MNFLKIVAALLFCTSLAAQSYKNDFETAEKYLDSLLLEVDRSHYAEVVAAAEAFIRHAKAHPDPKAKLLVAQAWSVKGSALMLSGNLERALECHSIAWEERVRHGGEHSLEAAFSCHNIGSCYLLAGLYDDALPWLLKSQRTKARFPQKHDGTTLEVLATVFEKKGDIRQARQYAQKALHTFGAQNPKAVNTLLTLHAIEDQLGHPDSALYWLDLAIPICQKNDWKEKLAHCFTKRGVVYTQLGEWGAAIAEHRAALDIWGKIPQIAPKKWGIAYRNLGNTYALTGDWDMAATYYEQAMPHFQHHSLEQAILMIDLGELYREKGLLPEATQAFRRAVELLWRNHTHEYQLANASAFTNLGTCLAEQREWQGALVYFEKAERIFRQKNETLNTWKLAQLRGYCALEQGDLTTATAIFNRLLQTATTPRQQFIAHYRLGMTAEKAHNIPAAEAHYQRAMVLTGPVSSAARTRMPEEQTLAATALARLWLTNPTDPEAGKTALGYAELAIERAEYLRQLARSRTGSMAVVHRNSDPYQIAIDICLELAKNNPEYAEKAWQKAQLQKNNFIRQTLVQAWLRQHPEWARTYTNARAALEQQREEQFWARYHQTTPKVLADSALNHLLSTQEQVFADVNRVFPQWDQYLRPASADIRAKLAPNQVLLQYQWLGQRLVVFVLRPDAFQVHTIAAPDSIADAIRGYWQYCTQKPGLIPAHQADSVHRRNTEIGQYLYQQLLAPVHADTGKTLLIVPDKYLCYLPFNALIRQPAAKPWHFWQHRYAVSGFHIQYAPSAGAFWLPDGPPAARQGSLAVAPVFFAHSSLDSLENNQKEARLVHGITGGLLLPQAAATAERFRAEAPQYDIIHLATHGILHPVEPAYSWLAFNRTDTSNYARLYLHDIYQMPLRARLVATTACHSGDGRFFEGEGLVSLAHAFQHAGAGHIVAALWRVDDTAAPALMRDFYTQWLQKGRSVAASLATAQAFFVRDNRPQSHPYYWAGFMAWGQADHDSPPYSGWWHWWWVAAILAGLAGLFVTKKIRGK